VNGDTELEAFTPALAARASYGLQVGHTQAEKVIGLLAERGREASQAGQGEALGGLTSRGWRGEE
jgi:hypothetical protein